MEKMKEVKNQVVLLTGASGGIGQALIQPLLANGYSLALVVNKNRELLEFFLSELRKENTFYWIGKEIEDRVDNIPCVTVFNCDLSKKSNCENLVKQVLDQLGQLDILINLAGVSQSELFQNITEKDWYWMLDQNLSSAFFLSQSVFPIMLAKKNGVILNVSSIWGQTGAALEVHYSVAKAGLIGLTKALAKELGASGIRVNCLAPGFIETKMTENYSEQDKYLFAQDLALGRLGKPEDLVNSVLFLISEASAYMTGQILTVDGGYVI